jgi:hypothetical protein
MLAVNSNAVERTVILPAEIFQRSESCLAKALTLREHPWLRQDSIPVVYRSPMIACRHSLRASKLRPIRID